MIFAFVARLAIWLLPHGVVRQIVVIIDDVALIGLLVYFGYEMFIYLWNRRPPLQRNGTGAAAAAALATRIPAPIANLLGAIARGFARLTTGPW